jgi:hypothetical protein
MATSFDGDVPMLELLACTRTRLESAYRRPIALLVAVVATAYALPASAIPVFNRQTGQNCQACHAGGQYPELTPYGRMFKLTGYTIGHRTDVPLAMMALASVSSVRNTSKSDDSSADFSKNNRVVLASASLFAGGRITDNLGAFVQYTYDPYASQDASGKYHSHAAADNMDIRYADRFVGTAHDLVFGVSANNNPSVADPWNTAAAWMQYVPVPSPSSSQFIDGATPYPGYAVGGNTSGLTAYAFLDEHLYIEAGAYRSTRGVFGFMKLGQSTSGLTRLQGNAPYVRAAWNVAWGASTLMIGGSTMSSRVYDDPAVADPATLHRFRDSSIDAQYQWLLDPHALTLQAVATRQQHRYPGFLAGQAPAFVDAQGNALAPSSPSDVLRLLRAKASYTWRATYGGSASYFDLSGTTNTLNQSSGYDPLTGTITTATSAAAPSTRVNGNLTGNPRTTGETLEAYWLPWQNLRVGAQYTLYQRYNGSARNYDGFGRNASDNDSLFVYAWFAY